MGERRVPVEEMATTSTAVTTVPPQIQEINGDQNSHTNHPRTKMSLSKCLLYLTKSKPHFIIKLNNYSTKPGLLSDVNVLDLTRVIAGPFCSMTLGDLGANVIKVESLDGDEARKWGPPFVQGDGGDAYYFMPVNRSKKSVCIDLKSIEGKKVLYDMARKSDVMIENFIPGKLDEMDVGYEKLSKLNPKLIYCAITGFGPTGPYAKKPGYDVIAAAMGGLLNSTGEPGGAPVKPGVPLTDICTGLHAFGAITTALYYRQKTGKGQRIDCNLLSTQANIMINVAATYLNCQIDGSKWGTAHASIVPYQAFKTKDGYMVIGTGSNAQFVDLCKLLNREDLIADDRFKTNSDRVKHRTEIIEIINNIIKEKTKKEWSIIFSNATFPNGPVNTMQEVFDDEHIKEIGLVKEIDHPDAGTIKLVGPPTVYSEGGNEESREPGAVITLRPAPAQARKRVGWTQDTVDNEHMNKMKSKCCCIYEKPHEFGESDSEDSDDECEHCFGHVERRKKRQHQCETATSSAGADVLDSAAAPVPTAEVTLKPPESNPGPPDKSKPDPETPPS